LKAGKEGREEVLRQRGIKYLAMPHIPGPSNSPFATSGYISSSSLASVAAFAHSEHDLGHRCRQVLATHGSFTTYTTTCCTVRESYSTVPRCTVLCTCDTSFSSSSCEGLALSCFSSLSSSLYHQPPLLCPSTHPLTVLLHHQSDLLRLLKEPLFCRVSCYARCCATSRSTLSP
jgi:hypothetical protein